MTSMRKLGFGLLAVTFISTSCCDKAPVFTKTAAKSDKGGASKEHDHGQGPNGGVILDLGKYHAEFTVDHGKKECTVLFIDGDDKDAKPMPVAAKELTVTTKEAKTKDGKVVPPMTIKMMPTDAADGKASKFVGADPTLANVADFAGTVIAEIDGKPSQGDFKEVQLP